MDARKASSTSHAHCAASLTLSAQPPSTQCLRGTAPIGAGDHALQSFGLPAVAFMLLHVRVIFSHAIKPCLTCWHGGGMVRLLRRGLVLTQ